MAESSYRYANGHYVRKSGRQGVNYDEFATECWSLIISFFRYYPDLLEDICESENKEFSNSLISRVLKRAMARDEEVFITGARGLGKTTVVVSDKCNKGILWPGEITGYYAPVAVQAAPLASKAFATYKRNTPILADHYTKNNDGKATFKVSTPLGSQFIMDIDRGIDTSGVVAEECAQEDRNPFNWADFNQIVLGTNRLSYKVNGHEDPNHIDSQIHYITSATRRENEAYGVYMNVRKAMQSGENTFALSVPWEDSDAVIFIHREAYYLPPEQQPKSWEPQVMEMNVAKNRHGETGAVLMDFMGMFASIRPQDGYRDSFSEISENTPFERR